jgi:hypothetical protein
MQILVEHFPLGRVSTRRTSQRVSGEMQAGGDLAALAVQPGKQLGHPLDLSLMLLEAVVVAGTGIVKGRDWFDRDQASAANRGGSATDIVLNEW